MGAPYRDITVGRLLTALAQDHPNAEALVYPDRGLRFTFAQLEDRCRKLARGLLAAGLRKGDRVAVWGGNVPEWIMLQFALAKIGSVLVTVNTGLQERELEYLLSQSESRWLVTAPGVKDHDFLKVVANLDRGKLPCLEKVWLMDSPPSQGLAALEELKSELAPAEDLEARGAQVGLDDVINMQYTSGTTGFPKGVMLSSRNIVNNAYWIAQGLGFSEKDRLCMPVPLFHCFGCVISVLGCFTHAACLVPLEAFDPLTVLRYVSAERCTALHGVPTMFVAELEHPQFENFDLSSLRTGVMAGSLCPEALMRRVMEKMHMTEITIAYGLTETSPAITMVNRHDSVAHRTQTVGQVLPEVEVRIVDPETREPVPAGTPGELCTRGYLVMLGYYNQPQETARALDGEGWLYTGDQATLDEGGYVRITGRIKDLIISGGENVSPKEVEDVLREHPDIVDLCVYGVPHPKFGEAVAVAIQHRGSRRLNRADLKEFCAGKLAPFKIPTQVAAVDAFPLTASGKIQRYKLRELYPAALGS